MEQEVLNLLFKELFKMNDLHEEFSSDDFSYKVDMTKVDDNHLHMEVDIQQNNKDDKAEFESWISKIPEDIFSEAISTLDEDIFNKYQSKDYAEVIDSVKTKINSILQDRMDSYKGLLS